MAIIDKIQGLLAEGRGGWEQTAVNELAAEERDDPEDYTWEKERHSFAGTSPIRVEMGRMEWIVFEDDDEAESYAVAYVLDQLDDDPSMFTQSWLEQFIQVTPTDIRIMSGEEGDSYAYDIDEDRAIEEADLEDEYEEIKDRMEVVMDDDPRSPVLRDLQKSLDRLIEQAREKISERISDDVERELKQDPVGWWEERGGDLSDGIPTWMSFDTKEAAQDAIDTDGVAHFLSNYDGNEIELDSGAMAYRQN